MSEYLDKAAAEGLFGGPLPPLPPMTVEWLQDQAKAHYRGRHSHREIAALLEALQLLEKVLWNYHNLPDLAPESGIDTYGFKAQFQTICDIDAFLGGLSRSPAQREVKP
jgi:hypothetical protein